MKAQFNNQLLSSFNLWINNRILNNGQGYLTYGNTTGYFQPETSRTGYCWAFPYKSLVFDSSVSGAVVMSGVYNQAGQFLTRNSGITIDYIHGRVFAPTNLGPVVSGAFSRNEYNVYVSTEEETEVYLDRLYNENPNIILPATGVTYGRFAAPCVILTNAYNYNEPFAFGGQDVSNKTIRAFIVSSNNYNQEAITSLMVDSARSYIPLITSELTPINGFGDIKGGSYNYVSLAAASVPTVLIQDVYSIKMGEKTNKNKNFTIAILEFDLATVRYPRQET